MTSESEAHRSQATDAREPIAIVGIAALYPQARGTDAYWDLMKATSLHCGCAIPAPGGAAGSGPQHGARWNHCGQTQPFDPADPAPVLDSTAIDVARFGIPPAQSKSMTRLQTLMLETARMCLTDAGYAERPLQTDRTDVIAGTCFGLDRQYANALRIESGRYVRELENATAAAPRGATRRNSAETGRELRSVLARRMGGSPHDRVGEMASTIPARIATVFKLRGRTLALESADVTSFIGIWHALNSLRGGVSDAVLVLAGQLQESGLLTDALAAKGLLAPGTHPFAADGRGFALGEGVGALLLKRRSSAVQDGDRIYASILDCSQRYDSRPGTFRYSTSVGNRHEAVSAAYRAAGVPVESIQYVECAGSGISRETESEIASLNRQFNGMPAGSVALGSVRDRLGHTFANAGLASLTKVALALYHRRIPPHWAPDPTPQLDLTGTPFHLSPTLRNWPPGVSGGPRRAAVGGASLTGALVHLVLEEHDARRPARTAPPPPPRARTRDAEPIAVIGAGAYFAGSPDAESFWRTTLSGRDRIGPVPESRFDRELHFAEGALSLTHSYTDQGGHVPLPEAPPPQLRITPLRYAAMDAAQRVALTVASELFPQRSRSAGPLTGPGLIVVGSNLGLTRERRLNAERALGTLAAEVRDLSTLAHLSAAEKAALTEEVRERYGPTDQPLSPADLDGYLASGVAALIANEFHLDALPIAVEAACASSLAALDVAVSALRSGAVEYAVTGGVELACNARDMVLCSSLGLLSHNRITPFDAGADGFTPGDGCALFLLKRHTDAVRDGDVILGLLRGVGASNDAKSLIAPDTAGQAAAMRQAFSQVDFDSAAVDYLEAHGTGTQVGDRVEIAAAAQVYGGQERTRPLRIGSAKSFFGHTFAAAGAAGLLRALLAIREKTLPPNVNLRTVNPALDLAAIPAVIATEPSPWPAPPGRPRRAGVSSFGTGGINYHLLVEEHLDGSR
ncbi:polyketide synthase [Streptomyces sp. SID13666]|uniref:beta-ketoacyl [acyl carrier protein] synthase domain-containing protein n=1 Tax=unclassified Streptomyces TaxID=2593676 RepID=UPI001106942F|nr:MULTISPECIES: polyketide synthase [unclassified Streptomyces]NEA57179.1 polyketide synthase [Streptomyces sp. SID13666]QNA71967.1 polyketide synthase [Streptomyces sp. So13.3]